MTEQNYLREEVATLRPMVLELTKEVRLLRLLADTVLDYRVNFLDIDLNTRRNKMFAALEAAIKDKGAGYYISLLSPNP
jgi:homoserine trans-succinylase